MKLTPILAAVALLATTGLTAAEEARVLKFGHAASSKHPFHDGLEYFAARVAEKTGGKIEIEVFGDRQLGDDKQLLEGLQIGSIEGAMVSSPVLPLVIGAGSFDALQLPFVAGSYEELSDVLSSPLGDQLLATLDEKSIAGLGFVEAGKRHFLARDTAVTSVEGFKGLKTRIVPIPLHKAVWEAVGVNPVGMAYGEIYSALETGTIEAVEINLSSIQSESLYESAKDVTLTGHYFWPGVIMVAGPTWESFDDETKTAFREAGREATIEAYRQGAQQEADARAFLEENGVTVHELDDLAALQAAVAPVVEEWSGKDPLIAEIVAAFGSGD